MRLVSGLYHTAGEGDFACASCTLKTCVRHRCGAKYTPGGCAPPFAETMARCRSRRGAFAQRSCRLGSDRPRLIISRLRELKYCTVPTESSQIFRHESPMEYLPFCRRVVDLDLRAIVFDACLLTEDNDWSSRVQARRLPGRATGQPIRYGSRGLLARARGRTMMIEVNSARARTSLRWTMMRIEKRRGARATASGQSYFT